MQIERTLTGVTTLGPGRRMAVWVNGCRRNCKGCVSPSLRRFAPENERDVDEYFRDFDYADIDGVTISGGEPFEQADELLKLVDFLLMQGIDDILVYTGYTFDELKRIGCSVIDDILSKIAVLIDGEYVESLNDQESALRGSTNQSVLIINESHREKYLAYQQKKRDQQIFNFGNYVIAVGIPNEKFLHDFRK